MGSTTSLAEQTASCGLCTKSFDYKKALEILKNSLTQYQHSLQNNIQQFKSKDQKIIRQDFNQVKQQALNYLKNDQQPKARKLITDYFHQQKQPKLITREIDFLDNKQKMLQKLRKNIDNSVKPYKNQQKRNQIVQFDRQLERIKDMSFNPHQDQKSGDSGDVQSYIDRIIDELKSKLPKIQPIVILPQKASAIIIIPQPQPQPQPIVVARQPSADEYRQKFLRKLHGSRTTVKGQRFRRLTRQEREFFKNSLGIQLTQAQQPTRMSKHNSACGYYLNCNGYELFDMQQLLKTDWPMVQVLDLQQCGISSHWWKTFANSQKKLLNNLKVVYLGLNQITQVNPNQLQSLHHNLQYLSFGWWNESNLLTPQSKSVIAQFQSKHPQLKIQFPCA